MELQREQNHYEILEVPYNATGAEIQTNYILAKKTYGQDALGGYSLFDEQERKDVLEKIEVAYHVLSDPQKRAQYDQECVAARPPSSDAFQTIPQKAAPVVDVPQDATMGDRIKLFREQRGLSLEDIAETTRINIHYLLSMEANRFEALPAEVYVYSYIRQVMKMLQCEDSTLAENYMKEYRKKRVPLRM